MSLSEEKLKDYIFYVAIKKRIAEEELTKWKEEHGEKGNFYVGTLKNKIETLGGILDILEKHRKVNYE